MSNLAGIEKMKLERLLGMGSGYVLDFSNRTFEEFLLEHTGIEIYGDRYAGEPGSKANRLRSFWQKESNYLVATLLEKLLEYSKTVNQLNPLAPPFETSLYPDCIKIVQRLKQESPVENIEAIQPNADDRTFELLAKSIKNSIEKNEPEEALDRLHTFVVRYVRELCKKHSIPHNNSTPLHSLFGGYVKYLRENKLIDSEMTERILESSIAVLEAFNRVRNNQSLAHPNPVLNYPESILIFNNIANIIRFIQSVEPKPVVSKQEPDDEIRIEDIPF